MTNFERMTDEEKKLAIIYGLHCTTEGGVKPCSLLECSNCPEYKTTCVKLLFSPERKEYLNREYNPPKTENEKFCETLKVGELIGVSDQDKYVIDVYAYLKFVEYNAETDKIITKGCISPKIPWRYGRKLTAEERGEEE